MKERGKGVEVYGGDQNLFQDYSFSSDLPCKKHPQSSSVGICPFCLRDRLVKLVCSDCGEQRLSSCSCSDELSSNPRTSGAGEVGSVGRVSFLLENENKDQLLAPSRSSKPKSRNDEKAEEVFILKRSSSSCVEIKRKNGFWRIGRFFRKRKDHSKDCGKSVGGVDDQKSDLWVVDHVGHVSRSRSLCSFRGNGVFGSEDGVDLMSFSGARSSISAARSSSVNGGLGFDPGRRSGFSEAEPRKSGFSEAEPRRSGCSERRDSTFMESDVETRTGLTNNSNRKVFSLRENFLPGGDEPGFIDLKFEFPSEAKPDLKSNYNWGFDPISAFGSMRENESGSAPDGGCWESGGVGRDGRFGSCRITVNERGIKKSRKSFKGWRWIFKHHQNGISMRKKGDLNCDSQMRA